MKVWFVFSKVRYVSWTVRGRLLTLGGGGWTQGLLMLVGTSLICVRVSRFSGAAAFFSSPFLALL